MIRFLRSWLVPILAMLLLAALAISLVPLSDHARARAESELNLILDRAFARIGDGAHLADPVIAAEEKNLLDKARAVARFLEHDDALLAGDALIALCEQLSIDRIDVANIDGTLIASSEAGRVDLALGAQPEFSWAMAAADDAKAALTHEDKTNASMLYACVGRADIEGFVLLTRQDPYAADALEKSTADAQIADLVYGGDVLFVAQTGGEDGFFQDSGSLCLRRTSGGITLIAGRSLNDVYTARNTAIFAFAAALTCVMICAIAAYLLRLEPVTALDDEEEIAQRAGEETDSLLAGQSNDEDKREIKRERRRKVKIASQAAAEMEVGEHDERDEQHERAEENAPRQAGRNVKQRRGSRAEKNTKEKTDRNGEDPFEKIVD